MNNSMPISRRVRKNMTTTTSILDEIIKEKDALGRNNLALDQQRTKDVLKMQKAKRYDKSGIRTHAP
ncbi:hypothetical protein N7523_006336 [Penicillium sp. IBT 18751x]|nr:hypothetical protein N7523_006336 [Penicillium sp. IBT 18751x]